MNSEAHFSVALISAPAVGHVLPLFHLAQVLSSKGVSAALLVSDVALAELIRNGSIPKSNVHCVALQSSGTVSFEDMAKSPLNIMKLYYEMMEPTKKALVSLTKGETLTDAFGSSIPSLPALKAIIASPFIFFGPPIAKELNLNWTTLIDTSTAGSVVTLRIAEEAFKVQDPHALLCQEGVKLPGFADFKTHELIKVFGENQLTGTSPTVSDLSDMIYVGLAKGFHGLIQSSDSILVNTSRTLDEKLLFQLKTTPPSLSSEYLWCIGPIESSKDKSTSLSPELENFLKSQKEIEKKKVVLIAFGSLASLGAEEENELVSAATANSSLAFILSGKSFGKYSEKLKASEHIFCVDWIPQRQLLESSSVDLFLSHAGWNSSFESLLAGVPMLVRPFGAEQFINANILEQVHQVAKAVRSSFRASLDYASAFQQFSDGKFDELSNASKAIEKKLSQEKQNRNSDEELDQWLALISRGKKR